MRIRYLFTVYLWIVFSACAKDDTIEISPQNGGDIKVNIATVRMPIPEVDNNATRVGKLVDENSVENLRVLLFDEKNIYIGRYSVSENNLVRLPFSGDKRTVYVVANTATQIDNSTWHENTTTLDEILGSLVQRLDDPLENPDAIPNAKRMPATPFSMYASIVFSKGINSNSSISSDGTLSGSPLLLKRNVAKIILSVSPAISKQFVIKRIMLCYAQSKGYVLQDKVINDDSNCNYTFYNYSGATPPSIYAYSAGKSTTIIIEASRGLQKSTYYKIAIKSSQAEGATGLKHNTFYRMQIVSVSGNGFTTLEDAINGYVLDNVGSTLEIRDITMHDYLFSKAQYIATSNSRYTQYGSRDGFDVYYDVSQIRFGDNSTEPSFPGGTTTSIDIKGIDGSDISSTIELDPQTINEINAAQNNVTYSIRIKLLKKVETKFSAIISLHFDDLIKEILVVIQPELIATESHFVRIDNVVTIYVDDDYANWAGVNDINILTTNKYINFGTTDGWPVYITIRQAINIAQSREVNIYSTKGVDRYNEFELYDLGRSKTYIIQRP